MLVYLNMRWDINSIKHFLKVRGLEDSILVYEVDDLLDELISDPSDVIIFDYKADYNLTEKLRTVLDLIPSIKVFAANSAIGQLYINFTEEIYILPNALNLMIYLWESPVFSLGNILNAEDLGREVFSVDDFAEIDTENEVIEFKTTIEDLGDTDLASIQLLKLAKSQLAETFRKNNVADDATEEEIIDAIYNAMNAIDDIDDSVYDEPSRVLDGLLSKRNAITYNFDDEPETIVEIEQKDKLMNMLRNTKFIERPVCQDTYDIPVVEEPVDVHDIPVIEEPNDYDAGLFDFEPPVVNIDDKLNDEFNDNNDANLVEEVNTSINDYINAVENRSTNGGLFEPIVTTEESTATIEQATEESYITEQDTEESPTTESSAIEHEVEESSVTTGLTTIEPKVEENIIYKEYNENDKDSYDEVVEYQKHITKESEITVEEFGSLREQLENVDNNTGVIGESSGLSDDTEYYAKQEDFDAIQAHRKELMDNLKQVKENTPIIEQKQKSEKHILSGNKTYSAPTTKVDKVVGIKVVESNEDSTQDKGHKRLGGMRRRSIKIYKNSFEYFKDKLPLTQERAEQLEEFNKQVISENYHGNNIQLENLLYDRGFITDDDLITFMKEYLHQNVMTLEDLMKRDVIIDEIWTLDESIANGILQISKNNTYTNSDENVVCVACCTRAFPLLKSLSMQYERVDTYVTLEKFIKIRLGREDD